MKILHWNDGSVWGDPNLRWGNPSYRLEPGDPGYVPWPPSTQTPTKKRRSQMTKNRYYPTRGGDQVSWLGNFRGKLPGYATALGLAPATVTAIVADCAWLIYLLGSFLPEVRTLSQAGTNAVNDAQNGTGNSPMTLPTFTPPAGGTPVAPGALNRIFALVQIIKDSPGYRDPIGEDLGIIGSEKGGPDFSVFGPKLKVKVTPAGVEIDWGWQGMREFLDLIELQVDRGAGWAMLAYDTTPGYTDTAALPASPAKWKYRAIYRVADQRVGQWSPEVTANVG
jgi:hypothetical protein